MHYILHPKQYRFKAKFKCVKFCIRLDFIDEIFPYSLIEVKKFAPRAHVTN